jgi:hypothetical protein
VRVTTETAKLDDDDDDDLGPEDDTDVDETDREATTDGDNAPPRPAGDRYSHSE